MRRNHSNGFHPPGMDPRRELRESLPLCHPHDDYLKDFTPMSRKFSTLFISENEAKYRFSGYFFQFKSTNNHQDRQIPKKVYSLGFNCFLLFFLLLIHIISSSTLSCISPF